MTTAAEAALIRREALEQKHDSGSIEALMAHPEVVCGEHAQSLEDLQATLRLAESQVRYYEARHSDFDRGQVAYYRRVCADLRRSIALASPALAAE